MGWLTRFRIKNPFLINQLIDNRFINRLIDNVSKARFQDQCRTENYRFYLLYVLHNQENKNVTDQTTAIANMFWGMVKIRRVHQYETIT